jgi:putative hydrolase of the HAD superfamily
MKQVIIFDVMGVIFKVSDDTNDLLIPYVLTLRPQTQKETIKKLYLEASLGKISANDFWAGLGFPSSDIDGIQKDYLDSRLTLDPGFIECVKTLKAKYTIALLSNDISEWSVYLRKRHRIEEYIDFAFISGGMGLRKPDPEIYKQALSKMNVKPFECVFIDDDPRRVNAAAELGIASILFNRNQNRYKGIQVMSFKELSAVL